MYLDYKQIKLKVIHGTLISYAMDTSIEMEKNGISDFESNSDYRNEIMRI